MPDACFEGEGEVTLAELNPYLTKYSKLQIWINKKQYVIDTETGRLFDYFKFCHRNVAETVGTFKNKMQNNTKYIDIEGRVVVRPTFGARWLADDQIIQTVWDEPTSKDICEEYSRRTSKENTCKKTAEELKLEDIIVSYDNNRCTLLEVVKITNKSVKCKKARYKHYQWGGKCPKPKICRGFCFCKHLDEYTYHKYEKHVDGWGISMTLKGKSTRLPKNDDKLYITHHYSKPIFITHFAWDTIVVN